MKQLNIENVIKMIKAMSAIMAVLLILTGVAFASERLCVISDIANIRSGPGTQYDVLWQVEKYHPFIINKKKGDWYEIKDFENDVAWIHKSLLSKIECVTTIKNKCNIRSRPDTKSQVLFITEKGVPFKVLERKKNWIKIKHGDGDVGWIYKTLVW